MKQKENGIVDRVLAGLRNSNDRELIKVIIRDARDIVIGDKMASRHAQKGTIGMILHESEMLFIKDGIRPDIIINPHALPSRMTVGQLIECVVGKVGALKGSFMDGTLLNDIDLKEVFKTLKGFGYDDHGTGTMYCGFTGKKLKMKIFIGPTYYQSH